MGSFLSVSDLFDSGVHNHKVGTTHQVVTFLETKGDRFRGKYALVEYPKGPQGLQIVNDYDLMDRFEKFKKIGKLEFLTFSEYMHYWVDSCGYLVQLKSIGLLKGSTAELSERMQLLETLDNFLNRDYIPNLADFAVSDLFATGVKSGYHMSGKYEQPFGVNMEKRYFDLRDTGLANELKTQAQEMRSGLVSSVDGLIGKIERG